MDSGPVQWQKARFMTGALLAWFTARKIGQMPFPHQRDDAAREKTRDILGAFVRGARLALRRATPATVQAEAARTPWYRRSFFWEGVAFGTAGRNCARLGPPRREPAELTGYRAMHYTGYGVWNGLARLYWMPGVPLNPSHWAAVPDYARLSPLIAGGISFALVASAGRLERSLLPAEPPPPGIADEVWTTATWHGCGRALWFLYMDNFAGLRQALDDHGEHRDALLEGLGIAISYTNSDSYEGVLERIRSFAPSDQPGLLRGSGICLNALAEDDAENRERVAAITLKELAAARDLCASASRNATPGEPWYREALALARAALH
jgi:hypothetical protein